MLREADLMSGLADIRVSYFGYLKNQVGMIVGNGLSYDS
jgi:hypothetical protein